MFKRDKSPAGPEVLLERGGEKKPVAADIARLALAGWQARQMVDDEQARLDTINRALLDAVGTDATLVMPGQCRISLGDRVSTHVRDEGALRALLGTRFGDLVIAEVRYRPEPKLLDIADGGDELAAAVRAALAVKRSQVVSYRAARK